MPYCTADQVARYLKLTLTAEDRALIENDLIPAAESMINRECRRSFEPPQKDETVIVDGANGYVVLPKIPVQSIISVVANDIEVPSSDYDLDPEAGILYSSYITPGTRNVKVTGWFGFDKVPEEISHVCVRLVAEFLKPRITEGFGIKGSWEQDSKVEFEPVVENNPDIIRTLKRWRKW